MKSNNNARPGLNSFLSTLIPTIVIAFLLLIGIASDSSGEPETGWGAVFAVFLLGPPLLIFGSLTLYRFYRYKKLNSDPSNSVIINSADSSSEDKPPTIVG